MTTTAPTTSDTPSTPVDGPHDRAALRAAVDAAMQLAAAGTGPVRTAVREAMADAVTDLVAPVLDRLATERNAMMTALESHRLNQRVGIVSVAQAVAATDEARRKDRRWKGAVAQARKEHARANELQLWGEQLLRAGSRQLTELVVSQREARSAVAERARLAEVLREVIARCEGILDGWGSDGSYHVVLQISREQYGRWRAALETAAPQPADGLPTPASAPTHAPMPHLTPLVTDHPRCGEAIDLGEAFGVALGVLATCTKHPHPADPWHQDRNHHGVSWRALDHADAPSADTDAAHGS